MRQVFSRKSVTALPSAARTTSGNSAAFEVGNLDTIILMADVTAVTGTGPNLTIGIEWSHNGVDWFTQDPLDNLSGISSTPVKKSKRISVHGLYARLFYTIGGTTPNYTFSVTAVIGS